MSKYTQDYYTKWGSAEQTRLINTLRERVNGLIHEWFLARYIHEGKKVLELGAGPGPYSEQMLRLGAYVLVTDLTLDQLELNRLHLAQTSPWPGLLGHRQCNIIDLSDYETNSFDVVVAFGGALSYAFPEHELHAMREILRVLRPGGLVVGSVMSLPGMWPWYYLNRPDYVRASPERRAQLFKTGDMRLHPAPSGHMCRMFRWRELDELVHRAGGIMIGHSGSNLVSMAAEAILLEMEQNSEEWMQFLREEAELCAEPGSQNVGTHMLFAAISRF